MNKKELFYDFSTQPEHLYRKNSSSFSTQDQLQIKSTMFLHQIQAFPSLVYMCDENITYHLNQLKFESIKANFEKDNTFLDTQELKSFFFDQDKCKNFQERDQKQHQNSSSLSYFDHQKFLEENYSSFLLNDLNNFINKKKIQSQSFQKLKQIRKNNLQFNYSQTQSVKFEEKIEVQVREKQDGNLLQYLDQQDLAPNQDQNKIENLIVNQLSQTSFLQSKPNSESNAIQHLEDQINLTQEQQNKIFVFKSLNDKLIQGPSKHRNCHKALVCVFKRRFKRCTRYMFTHYINFYKQGKYDLRQRLQELMDWLSKTQDYTLWHLVKMFRQNVKDDDKQKQFKALNRRLMRKMIRQYAGMQVMYNKKMKNKISNSNAIKSYALRCRSSLLIGRLQSK